jgi:hypothetical protein
VFLGHGRAQPISNKAGSGARGHPRPREQGAGRGHAVAAAAARVPGPARERRPVAMLRVGPGPGAPARGPGNGEVPSPLRDRIKWVQSSWSLQPHAAAVAYRVARAGRLLATRLHGGSKPGAAMLQRSAWHGARVAAPRGDSDRSSHCSEQDCQRQLDCVGRWRPAPTRAHSAQLQNLELAHRLPRILQDPTSATSAALPLSPSGRHVSLSLSLSLAQAIIAAPVIADSCERRAMRTPSYRRPGYGGFSILVRRVLLRRIHKF